MTEHEAVLMGKIPRAHHEIFLNSLHLLWEADEATGVPRPARSRKASQRSVSKVRLVQD
jgi:hypothetical protein